MGDFFNVLLCKILALNIVIARKRKFPCMTRRYLNDMKGREEKHLDLMLL